MGPANLTRTAKSGLLGGVGPVRLLAVLLLVVDGTAAGEIDHLGQRKRSGPGTAAEGDVLVELVAEPLEYRGHDDPLLDGQEAAVAVGDPVDPVPDGADVAGVTDPRLDALEPGRDLTGSQLAGWALAA